MRLPVQDLELFGSGWTHLEYLRMLQRAFAPSPSQLGTFPYFNRALLVINQVRTNPPVTQTLPLPCVADSKGVVLPAQILIY